MFNYHPARIFALGSAIHNFAKLAQIEIVDIVIPGPFEIDARNPQENVFVYAHYERPSLSCFIGITFDGSNPITILTV